MKAEKPAVQKIFIAFADLAILGPEKSSFVLVNINFFVQVSNYGLCL